jgi:predicted  nucleic acid-binding Zn-ribbon protein
MDQELIAYLEEHFRGLRKEFVVSREETSRQIGSFREEFVVSREETTPRFERLEAHMDRMEARMGHMEGHMGHMEEGLRHNGVEIEALRGDIRQVAEGVTGANERLDAFEKKVAAEFKEVRASIRTPFEGLDKRVLVLETEVLGKNRPKGKGRPPS